MKRWKMLLVVLACLLFIQTPAVSLPEPVQAAAKASKSGLVKEKGKYYYYNSKGKKVKNKWMTVKAANGKEYRYYFSKDGSALTGTKKGALLKSIGGKLYAFNSQGRALTGVMKKIPDSSGKAAWYYFDKDGAAAMATKVNGAENPALITYKGKQYAFGADGKRLSGAVVILQQPNGIISQKFYVFNSSNGAFNKAVTDRLNAAAAVRANAATLKSMLVPYAGNPIKETSTGISCFDDDGEDVIWTYAHFQVSVFHPNNGGPDLVENVTLRYN